MPHIHKMRNVLTTIQYVEGLEAIRSVMSEDQVRLLQALYNSPNHTASARELANLANIRGGYPVVNSLIGRLGHLFCDKNQFESFVPDHRGNGTYRWWAIWSSGYQTRDRGFLWEMLPEVAKALELLGWVLPEGEKLPEEVTLRNVYLEGSVCRITINAYERNREARDKCILHYGVKCVVCGFNFADVYGDIAEGFIHVHHLKLLSEIGHSYQIDPVEDLRPVCANCHAVIHRREPPFGIEELKSIIKHLKSVSRT
jgi:putative restriction endonuclease